ncbi:MAG: RnfABCDGE type electron transport complex subunit C [Clostridia bacterium]|nr:RnfABCDGE type electron transport complex subunit C [Clostridia bacterium]
MHRDIFYGGGGRLPGACVPKRKNTDPLAIYKMPSPEEIILPMSMHIGKPAVPVVNVGDTVCAGALVGEADGVMSSPVYSSISGMVTELLDVVLPGGRISTAVRITSDGEDRPCASVDIPYLTGRDSFIDAVSKSGIVGLGGAGFPTHVKLDVEYGRADLLLINCAECEPYITSDTCTAWNKTDDAIHGIMSVMEYLGIGRAVIGFERGSREMQAAAERIASAVPCTEIVQLRDYYPQGAERVLIYHATGRVVRSGQLPVDEGCIVCNISTVCELGRYLKTGVPLLTRCVTVDGGAVRERRNVTVPIGTRARDVINYCGGLCERPRVLLFGGPMMGVEAVSFETPILKNTNAILTLTDDEMNYSQKSNCIRCASCLSVCPYSIDSAAISRALKRGNTESLISHRVDACMECGCCSYVCPAKLPLAENNRRAKKFLKEARVNG